MKLSVVVITYNQRVYIEQCLDSILNQQTNFDWELIVGDDASTDGTREILMRYEAENDGRIKLLLHKENVGLTGNYKSVFEAAKGEYVAICEGDDYWLDMKKLQKQVDFLDSFGDYGFIGSKDVLYDGNKGVFINDVYFIDQKQVEERIDGIELFGDVFEKYAVHGPVTRTVTIMFRKKMIENQLDDVAIGDYVLQCILARQSKFARIDSETSVYRISSGISAQHGNSYNQFFIRNMMRLSELFPNECYWLKDKVHYLQLKIAVEDGCYREAMAEKNKIELKSYRQKSYCKYLQGPFSFVLLHFLLKLQMYGK